jgi:hypothetical protein
MAGNEAKTRRWRCREAQPNEQDVRSTTASGAMVFGYFLPKQKVARSPLRRAKPSRKRCALGIDKNGFRVLACGQPRNDDSGWGVIRRDDKRCAKAR